MLAEHGANNSEKHECINHAKCRYREIQSIHFYDISARCFSSFWVLPGISLTYIRVYVICLVDCAVNSALLGKLVRLYSPSVRLAVGKGRTVTTAAWWNMHPILAVYLSMVTEKKDTKILTFDTSRLVQWAISQKSFRSKRKTSRLSRTKNICCLSSFGPPGPPSSPVLLDFICISSHVFACVWATYASMYDIIMLYTCGKYVAIAFSWSLRLSNTMETTFCTSRLKTWSEAD